MRRKDLTPEQLEKQEALDRSWAAALRILADPEIMAMLRARLQELDSKPPAPTITREEFLAQTAYLDE